MRGDKDPTGSWNIIAMSRLKGFIADVDNPSIRCPSKWTEPFEIGCSPVAARARVVLPEPLSPTSAKVSPGLTSKLTPATA